MLAHAFMNALVFVFITRLQSQKPAHQDLEFKWPSSVHLSSSPLMLRPLSASARAHKKGVSFNVCRNYHWRSGSIQTRSPSHTRCIRSSKSGHEQRYQRNC
ncbi:hypothetical protein EFP66_03000 [Lacticaseibacillus paracasei]|nr:hypothetical protein [Lacticaseibacillus paracasei]